MKLSYKILLGITTLALALSSCDSNDGITDANTIVAPAPANSTANFLFINAVPDGVSLDFYVNGEKRGASVAVDAGQAAYSTVALATSGFNSLANTSIRAQATSGNIGGVLGSANLIYRATSTSINNFVASPNALYTFIALDSINRPVPLRTFSLQSSTNALAADVTYYNTLNGQQISSDAYKALPANQQTSCVPLGSLPTTTPAAAGTPVPAGTTDAGGSRFLVLTDATSVGALYPSTGTPATQSAIRFINAVPNSYLNTTLIAVKSGLWARLRPTTGNAIVLGGTGGTQNIMSLPSGFNPSVGSRASTVAFAPQTTPATTTYTLEISTNSTYTALVSSIPNLTFTPGKVYTIVANGIIGKTDSRAVNAIIVQHN